jgi:MFS family permease
MSLRWLSPDGQRLLVARSLRTFAYGYLGVILALYLRALSIDEALIGLILTAAIAGSTAMTVVWSLAADRYGRRRTAVTMGGLMAAGGLVFALTSDPLLLILGAMTGTISATSSEVGIFNTIDQAVLPQTTDERHRTWAFTVYNLVGNLSGAVGVLTAAAVGAFAAIGLTGADAYRPLLVLYAGWSVSRTWRYSRACRHGSSVPGSRASGGSLASSAPRGPSPGCRRYSPSTLSPAASSSTRSSRTGSTCAGDWTRRRSACCSSGSEW